MDLLFFRLWCEQRPLHVLTLRNELMAPNNTAATEIDAVDVMNHLARRCRDALVGTLAFGVLESDFRTGKNSKLSERRECSECTTECNGEGVATSASQRSESSLFSSEQKTCSGSPQPFTTRRRVSLIVALRMSYSAPQGGNVCHARVLYQHYSSHSPETTADEGTPIQSDEMHSFLPGEEVLAFVTDSPLKESINDYNYCQTLYVQGLSPTSLGSTCSRRRAPVIRPATPFTADDSELSTWLAVTSAPLPPTIPTSNEIVGNSRARASNKRHRHQGGAASSKDAIDVDDDDLDSGEVHHLALPHRANVRSDAARFSKMNRGQGKRPGTVYEVE